MARCLHIAREIASYIGTDHTELYINEDELLNMVSNIVKAYDEPMSDSSQIPSMAVSKLATEEVKVVVTGDGGDEVFCGYKMNDWVWLAQKIDFLGAIAHCIPNLNKCSFLPVEARAFINNRNEKRKTQFFTDVRAESVERILKRGIIGDTLYSYEDYMGGYNNWQERRMLLDTMTYLPDEVLCKMDRASMFYSLEARNPLLDYRVIEKSFEIDQRLKYKYFDKKHILKELTYKYVPKSLLDRPKRGFSPPIREWLRGPLKDKVEMYAEPHIIAKQGIFDSKGTNEIIEKQRQYNNVGYTSVVWSFYVFQEWYRRYIEDLW